MEQRALGRSGIEVTRIILGCGNFGGIGSSPAFFGRGAREEHGQEDAADRVEDEEREVDVDADSRLPEQLACPPTVEDLLRVRGTPGELEREDAARVTPAVEGGYVEERQDEQDDRRREEQEELLPGQVLEPLGRVRDPAERAVGRDRQQVH